MRPTLTDAIIRRLHDRTREAGLTFLGHDRVPPGDGGISYGQVVVATGESWQ